jgi:hypothetical protein
MSLVERVASNMRYSLRRAECGYIKIQYGLRMSDSGSSPTQNTSLLTNLKNKIQYNLHQAVYDPDANKFAEEQQKQVEQQKQDQQQAQAAKVEADTTDEGDPNSINYKRIAKKSYASAVYWIGIIIVPFFALMLAMIVANEFIVYPAGMRILFFILINVLVNLVPLTGFGIGLYYILKKLYSMYYKHYDMGDRDIMPHIFALLPITQKMPENSIMKILMSPFTYPKTELARQLLPKIMEQYYTDLQESFPDLNNFKNIPEFVNGLKTIKGNFESMHIPSSPEETNTKMNSANKEASAAPPEPVALENNNPS